MAKDLSENVVNVDVLNHIYKTRGETKNVIETK